MRFVTMALLLLPACQRKVCAPEGQMPAFWSAKKELFPDGTVFCDARSERTYETIHLDFDPEPRTAMVTVIQQLESKGWVRTSQKRYEKTWEVTLANAKQPGVEIISRGIF